jgi:hypothetical protein
LDKESAKKSSLSSSLLLEDSSVGWHADEWDADDESDTDAEEQVGRNLKSV